MDLAHLVSRVRARPAPANRNLIVNTISATRDSATLWLRNSMPNVFVRRLMDVYAVNDISCMKCESNGDGLHYHTEAT